MKPDEAKRLKDLERENARLIVTDQALDSANGGLARWSVSTASTLRRPPGRS